MNTRIRWTALLLLLILPACAAPEATEPAAPAGLSDTDRRVVEESLGAFANAVNTDDWAAVAALYADDARLMPPNTAPVLGREAIHEFFVNFPPIDALELTLEKIDAVGDLLYLHGSYTMNFLVEGGDPVVDQGKFLEVRRKAADGSWPMLLDMFSSDLPPNCP